MSTTARAPSAPTDANGTPLPTDAAGAEALLAKINGCRRDDPDPAPGVKRIHIADDGTVSYNAEAEAKFNREWEAGRWQSIKRDVGNGPESPPPRPALVARSRGARNRSSRGPAPVRRRGSRRGTSSRSSGSSRGDPDESDESDLAARPCACGCGADLTGRRPQTLYATDACRKRAERAARIPTGERLRAQLAEVEQSEVLATWRGLAAPERAELVDALELPRTEDLLLAIIAPPEAVAA